MLNSFHSNQLNEREKRREKNEEKTFQHCCGQLRTRNVSVRIKMKLSQNLFCINHFKIFSLRSLFGILHLSVAFIGLHGMQRKVYSCSQ